MLNFTKICITNLTVHQPDLKLLAQKFKFNVAPRSLGRKGRKVLGEVGWFGNFALFPQASGLTLVI